MRFEFVAALVAVLLVAGLFFMAMRLLGGGLADGQKRMSRWFNGRRRGASSVERCANVKCQAINRPGADYCARCGQSLDSPTTAADCDVIA